LKSDYLNTLSVGEHKITVSFVDGSVEGTLSILAAQTVADNTNTTAVKTSPATGNNAEIYFSAFIAFALILLATIVFKKRLNNN
jgi:hypothetical protein